MANSWGLRRDKFGNCVSSNATPYDVIFGVNSGATLVLIILDF